MPKEGNRLSLQPFGQATAVAVAVQNSEICSSPMHSKEFQTLSETVVQCDFGCASQAKIEEITEEEVFVDVPTDVQCTVVHPIEVSCDTSCGLLTVRI